VPEAERHFADASQITDPLSKKVMITASAVLSVQKRESAERENPSLPGVSGGAPLMSSDFPRAGGWEEKRPCYGENADAAYR